MSTKKAAAGARRDAPSGASGKRQKHTSDEAPPATTTTTTMPATTAEKEKIDVAEPVAEDPHATGARGDERAHRWRPLEEHVARACRHFKAEFSTDAFWDALGRELATNMDNFDEEEAEDRAYLCDAAKMFYFSDAEMFPTVGSGPVYLRDQTAAWRAASGEESKHEREHVERQLGLDFASFIWQSGAGDARFVPAVAQALEIETAIEMQRTLLQMLCTHRRTLFSTKPTVFYLRPERGDASPPLP